MNGNLRTATGLLGRAVRDDRRAAAGVLALLLFESVADAVFALSVAAATDLVIGGGTLLAVLPLALATGLAKGVSWAGTRWRGHVQSGLAERMAVRIEVETLLAAGDVRDLDVLRSPAFLDSVALVRKSTRNLAEACWTALAVGRSAVNVVLSVVLLVGVHPLLGVLVLFVGPSLVLQERSRRPQRDAARAAAEDDRISEQLLETCGSAAATAEIRIGDQGPLLRQATARHWQAATDTQLAGLRTAAWMRFAGLLVLVVGYTGALALTGVLAASGTLSAGEIVLVITVAGQLRAQVGLVSSTLAATSTGFQVLDHYARVRSAAGAAGAAPEPLPPPRRGIELRGLGYRYPGAARDALRGVDLVLPAGSSVALVGENGAGKSTLVSLLCGLRAPTSGSIAVDGVELDAPRRRRWSRSVAPVFQDYADFELVLRESVGVGDPPRAGDPEPVRAAIDAGDARHIADALPEGELTRLGTGGWAGAELSRGQWQRIAVARSAMRGRPALRVLDEPSSALDAYAERRLFDRYTGLARTGDAAITVLISHRFSTVALADLIVLLEEGEIVECGTHRELVELGGRYARRYAAQSEPYRPS